MRLAPFVALAALGACATAPKAAVPVAQAAAAAAPAQVPVGNVRAIQGGSPLSAGTSTATAALVKGSPEAKAAGLQCKRETTLGSNRVSEICTTKAEREAAAQAGKEARRDMRNYRSGQNSSGNMGVGQ